MTATRGDIDRWLGGLYDDENDYTHMIVVCDSYDYDDYPVYVSSYEDVHKKVAEYRAKSMQTVMEVYSKNHTKEEQIEEYRAFNYD